MKKKNQIIYTDNENIDIPVLTAESYIKNTDVPYYYSLLCRYRTVYNTYFSFKKDEILYKVLKEEVQKNTNIDTIDM